MFSSVFIYETGQKFQKDYELRSEYPWKGQFIQISVYYHHNINNST